MLLIAMSVSPPSPFLCIPHSMRDSSDRLKMLYILGMCRRSLDSKNIVNSNDVYVFEFLSKQDSF